MKIDTPTLVETGSDGVRYASGEQLCDASAKHWPAVDVLREERAEGVTVRHVKIHDIYEPKTEEELADFTTIQTAIQSIEKQLRSDDPREAEQGVLIGRELLDSSATVRRWKEYMTTALALYPLQRPLAPTMLDGTPVDELAKQLFLYGQDAVAIRKRGGLFAWLLGSYDGVAKTVVSLGGGAAVPESDAVARMVHQPQVLVVDNDERALKHVGRVAAETGTMSQYQTAPMDIIREFTLARDDHPKLPAASFDIGNALGIAEYFDERLLRAFLKKSFGLVRPGGALIFGNMLDEHPALHFHQKVIEWPGVRPRSRAEMASIARDVAVQSGDVTMYIPDDHVYACIEIKKPLGSCVTTRPLGHKALVS